MGAAVHLSGSYPVLAVYLVLVLGPLVLRDVAIGGGYHLVLAALSSLIGVCRRCRPTGSPASTA